MFYVVIVFFIIVVFFIGFAIGLSMPFLLKKYFDFSKENKSFVTNLKNEYDSKFNSIDESLQLLSKSVTDVKNSNPLISDIYKEYLTGIVSGGDNNESS